MKLRSSTNRTEDQGGYALAIVLIFCTLGLFVMASVLALSSNDSALTQRNNEYFSTLSAAEAATEKGLSQMTSDFMDQGAATVDGNLSAYRGAVPTAAESSRWNQFVFKNTSGVTNALGVQLVSDWAANSLLSQYRGLSGYAATYEITSIAQDLQGRQVSAGVQQDVQLATVPTCQFAIFYNLDMEINPSGLMGISGPVHCNGNIYLDPPGQLVFTNDVTSSQNIYTNKSPNDPKTRKSGTVAFQGARDSGTGTFDIPIGTNSSPSAVDAILQIPPATEPPTSPMGQQRLYNQADLILLVYDNQVVAEGGLSSGSVPLTWSNVSSFVNTNVSFYDKREGKTIQTTEINVGALKTWNDSGNAVTAALGRNIESVYVADLRTQSSSSEPGVRVTNGQFLPADGLTLATPDPLYVEGNYNAPTSDLGTSDTSGTVPAALIGDSINVLSANWSDTNSALGITNRTACDTTVNAAVLCGIVPSGNGYYSGGVENFFRLLENWKGSQLTYNGSMVVMFPSQIATAPWQNPGTIYIPPTTRLWSFDSNFTDPDKLPHIFPAVRVIVRTQWTALPTT